MAAQQLQPGLHGVVTAIVGESDTARQLGSGDVPVLGTPKAIALCEAASVDAVAHALDPGDTTVGTRIEFDHSAASPVGQSVTAQATLTVVDGRRLAFEVTVSDGARIVGRGVVHRVIVGRERFLASLDSKR